MFRSDYTDQVPTMSLLALGVLMPVLCSGEHGWFTLVSGGARVAIVPSQQKADTRSALQRPTGKEHSLCGAKEVKECLCCAKEVKNTVSAVLSK